MVFLIFLHRIFCNRQTGISTEKELCYNILGCYYDFIHVTVTTVKSQLYDVLSILAIGAYFIPIIIVLVKRIWYPLSFLLFSSYWMLAGVINVILLIPGININLLKKITVIYNMLDIPIALGIIYFITHSYAVRKFVRTATIGFVLLEIVNAIIRGLNAAALKYMLAIGLLLVLTAIIWEIVLYLRKLEHGRWERKEIFIYAALLFEYGTYIVIYIFDYHVEQQFYQRIDNFIIYYASSVIATLIAICGFLIKDSGNRKMHKYA